MTRSSDPEPLKAHWFQILLALADRDLHGSAIMQEVLERTGGRMRLWPGMLYGSLRELEDAGLVEERPAPAGAPTRGGKRRFYGITSAGAAALRREVELLAAYVEAAREKRVGTEPS